MKRFLIWFFFPNRMPLELPVTEMRRRLRATRERGEIEILEALYCPKIRQREETYSVESERQR